jgi:oligopeptide/dipeptide ABC transporter ATP-binding protein
MFGGRIVELATKQALFERPRHPYTETLLAAVLQPDPRLRGVVRSSAADVAGAGGARRGCGYAARCPYVVDQCRTETPELVTVTPGHLARCHRVDELRLVPLPRRVAAAAGKPA